MSKKKILLLSDDLRMSSGVGTVSKEFVLGTMDHYDWVQLGGAIKHPDEGKIIDLTEDTQNMLGIEEAYLKIYCCSGYGNPDLVRQIMDIEKPDAILHYTDPRFWGWLYAMEHEIRQNIPIFYYNIWDDLPYPHWNENFYESCDLIMNISRQTKNIVDNVWVKNPPEDWQVTYIPHGINEKDFHSISELNIEEWNALEKFKKEIFGGEYKPNFVLYYNNRNIRRKLPGDVILSFKTFCDMLPKEEANKCVLIMHTHPQDNNGTDLPQVAEKIAGDYKVVFSAGKLDTPHMNFLVNIADVTINLASNEGYGLGTAESLMAETPIIVNVTGGLQDQCGFKKENGEYLTVDDYTDEFPTNHSGKYKHHGEWVKPVWPACRSLQGSVPTPYIFDDRPSWEDAALKIKEWYDAGDEERKRCGELGREFLSQEDVGMTAIHMCNRFVKDMDTAFEKWKPRKRFTIYKCEDSNVERNVGIIN